MTEPKPFIIVEVAGVEFVIGMDEDALLLEISALLVDVPLEE